jgi:hypothetical protein
VCMSMPKGDAFGWWKGCGKISNTGDMDGMGGKGMMYTYQDKSIRMSNEAEGNFEQNSYTFLVDRMIHMRQKSVLK